jgi:plastocyanin
MGRSLALAVALLLSTGSLAAGYEVRAVTNGGAIEGKVIFTGPKPPPLKITPTKDAEVCGAPRESAQIAVAPDGAVGNAVVFIQRVEQGKAWDKPESVPILTNSQCDFAPRVQAVQVGTEMDFSNADPVFHNLHAFLDKSTIYNVSLPKGGRKIRRQLGESGMVRVDCDSHPWMRAWIFVAQSPYYALTGPDGHFVIKDLPPGSYTLKAWQEYTGVTEIPVTVKAGSPAPVTVNLKANGPAK